MPQETIRTEHDIGERLVEAFRAMPAHPVFSVRGALYVDDDKGGVEEALNWPVRFVPDRTERLVLLTWARCRATGDSIRARYREMGWSRSAAEKTRRRALRRILAEIDDEVGA